MRRSASASSGKITMSSTAKKYVLNQRIYALVLTMLQCDTFARSSDAVFELSLRFAEPFKLAENLSETDRDQAEKLMFLELTQGLQLQSLPMIPV